MTARTSSGRGAPGATCGSSRPAAPRQLPHRRGGRRPHARGLSVELSAARQPEGEVGSGQPVPHQQEHQLSRGRSRFAVRGRGRRGRVMERPVRREGEGAHPGPRPTTPSDREPATACQNRGMANERWPALPTRNGWTPTRPCTCGRRSSARSRSRAVPLNHSWAIALQVTARGPRPGPAARRSTFTMAFDFIDHELVIETADGERQALPLVPKSVADFYAEVMGTLDEDAPAGAHLVDAGGDPVAHPVRARHGPPFLRPRARQPFLAHRRGTPRVHGVPQRIPREEQPGAFLLGRLRSRRDALSGRLRRRARPAFMREAYSHEVISHGFWPGAAPSSSLRSTHAVPNPRA